MKKIIVFVLLIGLWAFLQHPAIGMERGYDLRGEWRYLSGDSSEFALPGYDDSQWTKLILPEKEKREPVGWYRFKLNIPEVNDNEKNLLGTEILIGNIVGNAEVFFNGQLITRQTGIGVGESRPLTAVIPPPAIRFGKENVIAIRVTGWGGGKNIGINNTPLALSPLNDSWLINRLHLLEEKYAIILGAHPTWEYGKSKSAVLLRDLGKMYRSARRLQSEKKTVEFAKLMDTIEQLLPKEEKLLIEKREKITGGVEYKEEALPEGVYQSEARYGILGRLYNDGLMLFNSHPAGFEFKYGQDAPYTVRYHGYTPSRIYPTKTNWVCKTVRIEGTRGKRDMSLELTHSSLFPGIMLNVNDTDFSFSYTNAHAKAPDYMGYISNGGVVMSPVNPQIKKRLTKIPLNPDTDRMPMKRNWLAFWFTKEYGTRENYPLIVVCENPLKEVSFSENENGVTEIHLKSKEEIRHLIFIYPNGIEGYQGAAALDFEDGLPKEFISMASFWASASLQFPIGCRESYYINSETQRVEIRDQFEYQVLDDAWNIGRLNLAPIPPALANAVINQYPVLFPEYKNQTLPKKIDKNRIYPGLNLLMKTRYGEYGAALGPVEIRYSLPIPSLAESGYLKVKNEELEKLINESLTVLCYPTAPNAVDRGYKGNTQGWMAYQYLNDNNRHRLWHSATTCQPFDPNIWNVDIEPFTRTPYPWTYFLEGPYYQKYDIDWGNGLPLYGYQKFAQYSGDWTGVKKNWEAIKAINRHFNYGDSWMWMSVSNADFGYGTGAGDCLCTSYASAISMARMAKMMGDDTTYASAVYRAAKTAVPMLTRLWMNKYCRENKMITPNEYVIGYLEEDGVLTISKNEDPWYMTSVISGNGVEPEVLDLYLKYAPASLREYEEKFEEFYPSWFDGSYKYGRSFTYPDNSGYSTLPHIISRKLLGYSGETVLYYIRQAQKTRAFWWVAPNVLAGVASAPSILQLKEWAPSQWVKGELAPDGKKAILEFAPGTDFPTTENAKYYNLILQSDICPQKILANKTILPTMEETSKIKMNRGWFYNEFNKELMIRYPRESGNLELEIRY